jgi:hypothetical protein
MAASCRTMVGVVHARGSTPSCFSIVATSMSFLQLRGGQYQKAVMGWYRTYTFLLYSATSQALTSPIGAVPLSRLTHHLR